MIRAVFFDFYTVWTPDKLSYYLAIAQQSSPEVYKEMSDLVESYYHGKVDVVRMADMFRAKLGRSDIGPEQFQLNESSVSPQIVEFMRNLHGHFLKLGILANLGMQEYQLLNNFNQQNQVLEVIASPLTFQSEKPLLSKEVFAQALQIIGEPLASCVYVSGNPAVLEFANSLGMSTIQFEGFPELQRALDQMVASDLPQ